MIILLLPPASSVFFSVLDIFINIHIMSYFSQRRKNPLNPTFLSSYHPISLPICREKKTLEKGCICSFSPISHLWNDHFLSFHSLWNPLISAIPFHSNSFCQAHLWPSLCQTQWSTYVIILHDPSEAFDTIDHFLLFESQPGYHILLNFLFPY